MRGGRRDFVKSMAMMVAAGLTASMAVTSCSSAEGSYEVNSSRCSGCGRCSGICPEGAISVSGKASIDAAKCIGCGRCAQVCPEGAISRV